MPTIYIPLQCSLVHKIKHYITKIFNIMLSIFMVVLVGCLNIITALFIMALLSSDITKIDPFLMFIALSSFMASMLVDGFIIILICDHFNVTFECIHNGD
jgi:hypothetical protein